MTTRYALPPEWVVAIREDAESYLGNVGRMRAGIIRKISEPYRVSIRVGQRFPAALPFMDVPYGGAARPEYVKHPPVCQACGLRIQHGTKAVRYRFHKNSRGLGRVRYIHYNDCPEAP